MVELITDFRKTALIAGIAIAASALCNFFRQLLIIPNSTSRLVAITALSLIFLFVELPLPVFLLLLYRTGIRPTLSSNLALMATTLAVFRGAAFLFSIREVWRAGILPDVSRAASLAGSQSRFVLSPASHWWTATLMISNVVSFGSEPGICFFPCRPRATAWPFAECRRTRLSAGSKCSADSDLRTSAFDYRPVNKLPGLCPCGAHLRHGRNSGPRRAL